MARAAANSQRNHRGPGVSRSLDQSHGPSALVVVRTPFLPIEACFGRGQQHSQTASDPEWSRAALQRLLRRPEVREALFLASPSLFARLEASFSSSGAELAPELEPALTRYLARMAGRPTPFGLFAAVSTGCIAEKTRLSFGGVESLRRRSTIDALRLRTRLATLARDPKVRAELSYRPNSSAYEVAGRLRFVECDDVGRALRLVQIDLPEYLRRTLERAEDGAQLSVLADALCADDCDVTADDATEYVNALVDDGLLVPDLLPALTDDEPLELLIRRLHELHSARDCALDLETCARALTDMDAEGVGLDPRRYELLAQLSGDRNARDERAAPHIAHVELSRPSVEVTLGRRIAREILSGVELLGALHETEELDDLADFRSRLLERFGDGEVPLADALDDDIGVGFGAAISGEPPLGGLGLSLSRSEAPRVWRRRDDELCRHAFGAVARGDLEIALTAHDADRLKAIAPLPLPDAFSVLVALTGPADDIDGSDRTRILIKGISGPSGAGPLARFCRSHHELAESLTRHVRGEQALRPDAIFAEIVHDPGGNSGNVMSRPRLYEHEIPYLGASGVPSNRQLPLSDLRVRIDDGRVVLRSVRLGREVIPRHSTAHGPDVSAPPVYRFLLALQNQGVARPAWDWGPLVAAPFLPRVRMNRVVLARARWRLDARILRGLIPDPHRALDAMKRLREHTQVCRFVTLLEGGRELLFDLAEPLSAAALAGLINRREQVDLYEADANIGPACATSPEGTLAHELVVPFLRRVAEGEPRLVEERNVPMPERGPRSLHLPGTEWLFIKVYSGAATADMLLRETLAPAARRALATGAADSWHFLRYADPELHIRLRIHGDAARLCDETLPDLSKALERTTVSGLVWRMQLDTYIPEQQRYGGASGLALAEAIFHADSDAVVDILDELERAGPADARDARWQSTLLGVDRLFSALGLDDLGRYHLVRDARDKFGREFGIQVSQERELGSRFRKHRGALEALLANAATAAGQAALARRDSHVAKHALALRALEKHGQLTERFETLAWSFAHMHVNRMLRSSPRLHELVLYDWLRRIYESRLARANAPQRRR